MRSAAIVGVIALAVLLLASLLLKESDGPSRRSIDPGWVSSTRWAKMSEPPEATDEQRREALHAWARGEPLPEGFSVVRSGESGRTISIPALIRHLKSWWRKGSSVAATDASPPAPVVERKAP